MEERVPEIRFEGFEGPWAKRILKEIIREITRTDSSSDAPVMMISANYGFIEQADRYAFNNAGDSLNRYILLQRNELAYNHGASKIRPYGSCFALTTLDSARVPFVYHCFSTEVQNAEFLSIELNGHNVESQLRRIVCSSARMDGLLNISFEDYSSISVFLPSIEEQNLIAEYISRIDTIITLNQQKLDKLKTFKKSCLEKMFPKEGETVPEVRFKGFEGPWEKKKLGDVVDITMGQSPDGETYSDKPNKYILIQGNADLKNGWVFPRIWTSQMTKVCQAGDLIMSVRAPAGAMGKTAFNAVIGRGVAAIKGNEFIFQLLCKLDSEGFWKQVSTGSTFDSINTDTINDAEILIPVTEEQKIIGKYLFNLDTLITLNQQKLDKLKNLKKALLDKMFV